MSALQEDIYKRLVRTEDLIWLERETKIPFKVPYKISIPFKASRNKFSYDLPVFHEEIYTDDLRIYMVEALEDEYELKDTIKNVICKVIGEEYCESLLNNSEYLLYDCYPDSYSDVEANISALYKSIIESLHNVKEEELELEVTEDSFWSRIEKDKIVAESKQEFEYSRNVGVVFQANFVIDKKKEVMETYVSEQVIYGAYIDIFEYKIISRFFAEKIEKSEIKNIKFYGNKVESIKESQLYSDLYDLTIEHFYVVKAPLGLLVDIADILKKAGYNEETKRNIEKSIALMTVYP